MNSRQKGDFFNIDCMEGMKSFSDKYFELAIVDPPYGIVDDICSGGPNNKFKNKVRKWDSIKPSKKYFNELFRVSKNQIIWGGNYFTDIIPVSRFWICYEKRGLPNMPRFELAWGSFKKPNNLFTITRYELNMHCGKIIHPTQKPIKLYRWLLKNYARPGDKILDSHVGSGSSLIACIDMGFEYTGYELDPDYYQAACKRIKNHTDQLKLV